MIDINLTFLSLPPNVGELVNLLQSTTDDSMHQATIKHRPASQQHKHDARSLPVEPHLDLLPLCMLRAPPGKKKAHLCAPDNDNYVISFIVLWTSQPRSQRNRVQQCILQTMGTRDRKNFCCPTCVDLRSHVTLRKVKSSCRSLQLDYLL